MSLPVNDTPVEFSAGLNNTETPIGLVPGTLTKMDNVVLSDTVEANNALEARAGISDVTTFSGKTIKNGFFFGESTPGTSPVAGLAVANMAEIYSVTTASAASGQLYSRNPDTGATTQIATGQTKERDWYLVSLEDTICAFNGVDTPLKGNAIPPASTSAIGLTRLDVSSSASAVGSAGLVKGTVTYFIAPVSSSTEGTLSAPFGYIDAGDGNDIDLTAVPVGSTGTIRLYRTFADGANPYYVTTLTATPDTTTTYTDNLPDRNLGNPPLTHGDPPVVTIGPVVTHFNRIFGLELGASRLFWSDLNKPESWYIPGETESDLSDFGNYLDVFGDDGDSGTALARTHDGILVFKNHHLYKVRGRVPDQFFVDEITLSDPTSRTIGAYNQKAITAGGGSIFFHYLRAIYQYSGGTIRRISQPVEADLQSISDANLGNVQMGYWSEKHWVLVSTGTKTLLYDLSKGVWVGSISKAYNFFLESFNLSGGREFRAGPTASQGELSTFSKTAQADDATAISTEAELAPFYGSNYNRQKRFMYVDIYFEPKASGTITVEWEIDGKSTDVDTASFALTEASTDRYKRRVNIGLIGRELIIRIKSNADQPRWKIYSMTYGWQDLPSISN